MSIVFLVLGWTYLTEPAFSAEMEAVEAGQTIQVTGPGVFMSESMFRLYVQESRELPICREGLDKALEGIREKDQHLAQLQLDQVLRKNRSERNVAIGIAGGFLLGAGSIAAVTVLAGS